MKRRRFLKNLSAASAAGLLSQVKPLAALASQQQSEPPAAPAAKAVRGLISKDGKFFQPVQIPLPPPIPTQGATATIRVDGIVRTAQMVASGTPLLEALVPAVEAERTASVALEISGETVFSGSVLLKPVRKVVVYVLPHSHNDIGYTDIQSDVEKKQLQNIRLGIELARKTSTYPEGARFVWNLEGCWAPDLWMRRTSDADRAAFIEGVKKGWLALHGMYANELTGLCRPEELLQLFRRATQLGETCGVRVDSAMISDVPGATWGTVNAMAQAGIRYFSAAPNWFDRIGDLMQVWQERPFWWIAPSGKDRVLVWVPWTGYAMSHVFKQITPDWVGQYQDRLDQAKFPYEISYIRWSGHGDNAEPDPAICEDIQSWNAKFSWPKFFISSTSQAFSAFEQRHGKELPEFKGDLTPYWEDGAGSSALETAMNRNAAERLVQALALFALSGAGEYPVEAFTDAWRNVLLYSEHTWGAWNSVSDSENDFVKKQWEIKRSFAVEAERQSRELLERALPKHGTAASASESIDIYNSTSWPRTELVIIPKALSAAGDRVSGEQGEPVPAQRLANGDLTIWASVPGLGAARFRISQGAAHATKTPVTAKENILENGNLRVHVDPKAGAIDEVYFGKSGRNLVDTKDGEQLNQYLFLPGSNLGDLQTSRPARITVEEGGPLVASLRIECDAPGCNSLVRTVRLAAGSDYFELINLIDKKRAAMNPNPGKDGPGGDWAQRGGKESLQFAFPFNVSQGQMRLDIPFAVMRPELDQLPGACKNWLPVGRWIDVANEREGVTWATLDAPLVEIGEIRANLLGSQRDPSVWRKHVAPTQKFYSWVMNNHWGTNYRAYQEGPVTFRYAIRPHSGYDPAAAARFAMSLTQPLVPVAAGAAAPRPPLLRVEPNEVLVTTLKPSDDGKAWIVRLFGASGKDEHAKVIWSSPQPKGVWISDLGEKPLTRAGENILIRGWDLVTLRAERA